MNKIQVSPSHYNYEYDTKSRFISYWYQINEIISKKPEKILEIGVGNKFIYDYLKKHDFDVTTVDIDERLNPDYVASVLDLPFGENEFDLVACFEVLEHIRFKYFEKALKELHRVSSKYVILSIPDAKKTIRFRLPILGSFFIPVPQIQKPIHKFDGEHYWEINKKGFSLSKIENKIEKSGFKIEKTHGVPEHPYHRFFVLKIKINQQE